MISQYVPWYQEWEENKEKKIGERGKETNEGRRAKKGGKGAKGGRRVPRNQTTMGEPQRVEGKGLCRW